MEPNRKPNELIKEKSPYLIQHAYNPVHWFPWGEEAFQIAKDTDKPIFLSVGYSTCHWCHVMAHESFEDETVAAYLNEHFVAIKVDREERPDIDHVYMMYCQALTGEGGWPLTIVMTPEGHPFFAGTYFPKIARYGRPGILDILSTLHDKWQSDKGMLRQASQEITNRMQPIFSGAPGGFNKLEAIESATSQLTHRFDEAYGGFTDAPKFPSFQQLMYLLRYYRVTGENDALHMVVKTLDSIARGGITDQVGGGIARYSTDAFWRVPHFEKMLYDNALAILTYAEAYQVTKDETFKTFVDSAMQYVEREMLSEEGGFYAAQDADSEGQEGRFYVWRPDEVIAALDEVDGSLYCDFYDITEEGNFEGYSVPNYIETDVAAFAASRGMTEAELWTKLNDCHHRLYEWRAHRTRPATDDKVLTAWNAMMVAAFAKAGAILGRDKEVGRATFALSFIERQLVDDKGRLLARYRDGESGILAYADDYAYLIWAYLEVYQATLDPFYLSRAKHWQKQLDTLFWDVNHHGYFLAGKDAEKLIAEPKTAYDGATPSANSVSAYNLVRLYAITGDADYAETVDDLFAAFGENLSENPSEHLFMLMAGMLVEGGSTEVVVVQGQGTQNDMSLLLQTWHADFRPEAVILTKAVRQPEEQSVYPEIDGETALYVCRNFQCERPDTDWVRAMKQIADNAPRLNL